ncbi:mannitol-1-phosphate dehydrogenase MPDH1 [Flagelloscypha sp. PMI_526]|nr:mannitol-1-phosphate dehydrogenase MPDH1 [Flagelloscypha sp. PMI_526]
MPHPLCSFLSFNMTQGATTAETPIPQVQRAALLVGFKQPLELRDDFPVVQPDSLAPGECLVKLSHAGVCHSDLSVRDGAWTQNSPLPLVAGHEGVGHVVAIGKGTLNTTVKIGDRVGVRWTGNICTQCEMCRKGHDTHCLLAFAKVHGYRIHGVFQEYVVSYIDYVSIIPPGIESPAVVPAMCAGLTIYKAIKNSEAQVGQWIAIPGAGGGLGHLGVQIATAMGLRVCAIDTGEEKRKLVTSLGAEAWVDFKTSTNLVDDVKKACGGGGAAAAVISVGSPKAFEQAIGYLSMKGVLVAVGMPPKEALLPVPIVTLIAKGLKIVGSAIGGKQDMIETLDLFARGKVKCHHTIKPLSSVNEVYDDLENERVAGRVVLEI